MVVLGTVLFFYLAEIVVGDVNILLNPAKPCVPTTVHMGNCHICVCTIDGIFNCENIVCDLKKVNNIDSTRTECSSLYTYRQDTLICSCSDSGLWRSERCKNRFHQIRPKENSYAPNIGTNIPCTPDEFYIYDCNICSCGPNNVITFQYCTNRLCPTDKTKVDSCNPGEIIKTEKEVCACSDINYFIDRHCIRVTDDVISAVTPEKVESLIYLGNFWDNLSVQCKPFYTYTLDCSTCNCDSDGKIHCDNVQSKTPAIAKPVAPVSKKLAPIIMLAAAEPAESAKKRPLPEIREGEPCFPGKLYKLDCNTCRCTKDKTLMCTKMGCFDWKNLSKKTNTKHALRSQEEQKGPKKLYLPKAQNGTECKPGKIYRSKCKRCYCTNDQNIVCSKKNKEACTFDKFGNPPPIMVPEDIHPPMMISDIHTLAPLPSASEQCEPGKSYRVDCNSCICMDSHNLLCQKKLCISYDDMNRIEAKELSGQPCQDEPAPKDCIRCKCEGGKTACSAITDCSVRLNQNKDKNHAEYIDPAIDKFKCVPHSIYKQDCNRCYCQEDSTLRCTQKTCLNYSQVKLLEEQRDYLEKHGL